MKTFLRILIFIFIILYGYGAVVDAFGPKCIGIIDFVVNIPLCVVAVLTFAIFCFDFSFYKVSKSNIQFLPSIVGCFICSIVSLKLYQRHHIDTAATLFTFNKNHNPKSFLQLRLKENGNFTLNDFEFFSQTFYYGQYTQKGDTITLTDIMKNRYLKQTPVTGIIQQNKIYFKGLDTLEMVN